MKSRIFVIVTALIATLSLSADAKSAAKAEIGRQLELLKKGDVDKLRLRFTQRQRERVTADKVKNAQAELNNYTLDDLVASVIEDTYKGQKTIKIKMKNGRTLTTLVQQGGEWYADTIWFR